MWIALADLPADGASIEFTDPAIWAEPMKEFGMACRVLKPLIARMTILAQQGDGVDGCLFRGTLKGEVALPCNRCAEDAIVTIDSTFDTFEPFPPEAGAAAFTADSDAPDELVTRREKGVPQINPEALLWEEFVLALPVKPLCRPDCKGLCPSCGHNKNYGDCDCAAGSGDPRLAVLRSLKLSKKS